MSARHSRIFDISEILPLTQNNTDTIESEKANDNKLIDNDNKDSNKLFSSKLSKFSTKITKPPSNSTNEQHTNDHDVYDFDDEEVNIKSAATETTNTCNTNSSSTTTTTTKGECVKPKRQWMRLEDMFRYQEARKESFRQLQQTSSQQEIHKVDLDDTDDDDNEAPLKKKQKLSKKQLKKVKKDKKKKSNSPPPPPSSSLVQKKKKNQEEKKSDEVKIEESTTSFYVKSKNYTLSVNDIVWAKLSGYPYWPCKIVSINSPPPPPVATVSQSNNSRKSTRNANKEETTITVVWYQWENFHSSFPPDKVLPFNDNYEQLFQPKRRGQYVQAVKEAIQDSGYKPSSSTSPPPLPATPPSPPPSPSSINASSTEAQGVEETVAAETLTTSTSKSENSAAAPPSSPPPPPITHPIHSSPSPLIVVDSPSSSQKSVDID